MAGSLQASAGWFWSKDDDIKVVEVKSGFGDKHPERTDDIIATLPSEWVNLQGRDLKKYISYLHSLKLRNVHIHHVIASHAKQRGHVWNRLPPSQWWPRMSKTLGVVDRMASSMNSPVTEIVSAYRCPKYNARCSGPNVNLGTKRMLQSTSSLPHQPEKSQQLREASEVTACLKVESGATQALHTSTPGVTTLTGKP